MAPTAPNTLTRQNDGVQIGLSPDLLRQATRQAVERGLVKKMELADVRKALRPFGGIGG
jgi:hypothetical protein